MIEMRFVKYMKVGQGKEPFAVRRCVGELWKDEQILRGKPVPLSGGEWERNGRIRGSGREPRDEEEKTHNKDALEQNKRRRRRQQ